MRVLIATSHRNVSGGVEKYLQWLLPVLTGRGHELALVYEFRFDPEKERVDAPDLAIPCCGIDESGDAAALRFIHDWKPDVVYSQGLEAAGFQSAVLNEYPAVLYAHNYVGTCVSGQKCHSFPAPQRCDRRFGAMCLALYFPRRCGGLHPGTMWKLYQRSQALHAQLPEYGAVLVASEHMRREFERNGVPLEKLHLAALPNPHETAPIKPPAPKPSGSNLLFMGRLTRLKGARDLLRALPWAEKKLGRPLHVTIAGDGPERGNLEEFARKERLAVEFPGWLDTGRKVDLMRQADLLVVPSLWPEPFGLVGIEAGSYGVPAVGYDVGGISEWLIGGYSGELASSHPPTVEGLADAIARALHDPAHYADLRVGAREVATRFTAAAHLSKLEAVLETVRLAPAVVGPREETIHAQA